MRTIRNIAWICLVAASLVKWAGTDVRADSYFQTCQRCWDDGGGHVFCWTCDSSCESLADECAGYCNAFGKAGFIGFCNLNEDPPHDIECDCI